MAVRTSHRDGGGAYLLLDGSRCMTGDLCMPHHTLVNTNASTLTFVRRDNPLLKSSLFCRGMGIDLGNTFESTTSFMKYNRAAAGTLSLQCRQPANPTTVAQIQQTLSDGFFNIPRAGQVIFTSGGLPFACISVVGNANNTVIAGAGTKAQFVFFDTDSAENNADADHTNDHIVIQKAGKYLIVASAHLESDGAGGADLVALEIYINDGDVFVDPLHGHRQLSGGAVDIGSMTISGIANLQVNDTVELWVTNVNSGDDILLEDVSLSLMQVGS